MAQLEEFDPRSVGVFGDRLPGEEVKPGATELLGRLRKLSEEELERVLSELNSLPDPNAGLDLCLTEIIRRGGQRWDLYLASLLDQPVERADLRLLTALRRVQKRPDPVTILVDGKLTRECSLGYMPVLGARLTNLDAERRSVSFYPGMDRRSARRAHKWHVGIVDPEGKKLLPVPDLCMGGAGCIDTLHFGESWSSDIATWWYSEVNRPGRYTVTLFYHDSVYISDCDNLEGLIVSRSLPMKLTVKPVHVRVSTEQEAEVRTWISQLPEEGPVRMHGGVYGDGSHEFIKPDGPAGKLLVLGWPAVPELIHAALDEKTSTGRRAWELGMLYSITGMNRPFSGDPFNNFDDQHIIGAYEYYDSGVPARWRYDEAEYGMHFLAGSTSGMALPGGVQKEVAHGMSETKTFIASGQRQATGIDADKQLEFVKDCWRSWLEKKYIVVERN